MIHINKQQAPTWFVEFISANPKIRYKDLSNKRYESIRTRLREELSKEQHYICCYCCAEIKGKNCHNEHILPQKSYENDTMDYNNLLASCDGYNKDSQNCGHKKGGSYNSTEFVSPLEENCEDKFKYYMNGEIAETSHQVKATINLLNLNRGDLVKARGNILAQSRKLPKETAEIIYSHPYEGKLQPFCNIVKYFLHNKPELWDDVASR